jgi:hypothetical protein
VRHEEYMRKQMKDAQMNAWTNWANSTPNQEDENEQAGKMAYGGVDIVNNPPHYNQAGIECIDAIEAALSPEELRGYYKGNVLKYTWRERYKNGDEDISKAQWYTNRLLTIKNRLEKE